MAQIVRDRRWPDLRVGALVACAVFRSSLQECPVRHRHKLVPGEQCELTRLAERHALACLGEGRVGAVYEYVHSVRARDGRQLAHRGLEAEWMPDDHEAGIRVSPQDRLD